MIELLALDLESVLIPEIWVAVGKRYGLPELARTTREERDYSVLMRERLRLCAEHGLSLSDLRSVVRLMDPLPEAVATLTILRARMPVVILSDTFYELAGPALERLGFPLVFCHTLKVDPRGRIIDFRLRGLDSKRETVGFFQGLGYRVIAVGDSLNDLSMLDAADQGALVAPSPSLGDELDRYPTFESIGELPQALGSLRLAGHRQGVAGF